MTTFKRTQLLGNGSDSDVYSIRSDKTGNEYACKVVKPSHRGNAEREAHFLEKLSGSKYTPKFHCIKHNKDGSTNIVVELCTGGTLLDYVQTYGPDGLTLNVLRFIYRSLLLAVKYIHSQGVVHRDIKAENIMFRDPEMCSILLIDFGFAGTWGADKWLYEDVGSLDYAPPEILKGHPYRGPEVDLFSLGVVFYICATGKFPYKRDAKKDIRFAIESRKKPLYFRDGTDALLVDIISQMLQLDRDTRHTSAMNIDSLISHPFFSHSKKNLPRKSNSI